MSRPKTTSKIAPKSPAKSSVLRCLDILKTLATADEDLSLQRIASSVDLHTSTTHRLITLLAGQGFVEQKSDLRYRLGVETFLLGSGFLRRFAIRRAAIPFLMKISEATGLTVNLGVWNNHTVVIIDCIPAPGMSHFYEAGSLAPLHATGLGKVLLAFRTRPDLERIGPMHRYTDRTISSVAKLKEELARIRQDGYAMDDEECIPGGRCVAAPILMGDRDPVAAVSVTAPRGLIPDERSPELADLLKERCLNISLQLGFPSSEDLPLE